MSTIDKAVYECPISVNSLIDTLKVLKEIGSLNDMKFDRFYYNNFEEISQLLRDLINIFFIRSMLNFSR